MTIIDKNVITAPNDEQTALQKLGQLLAQSKNGATAKIRLVTSDGQEIELPDAITDIVYQAAQHLAQGRAVGVFPTNRELTTQEAADLLNVSRPFLITLLEKGDIPYKLVGTHRRIRFDHLMLYKLVRDEKRKRELDEIAQFSQDMGAYD